VRIEAEAGSVACDFANGKEARKCFLVFLSCNKKGTELGDQMESLKSFMKDLYGKRYRSWVRFR